MALTMAEVARDYETDGVPSSGPHKIKKNNLRGWGAWVEGIISAFLSNGGLIYVFKSTMDGDLAHPANVMAWVVGDPVAANNGIYKKLGASGAGSWDRVADLPYSFIIASDVGAGTANAIQATTSLPVSGSALVWTNIFEANTASPVTISFNGGTALTVKTNAGNDVAAGGLAAGTIVMGIVSGSTFRLVSDQASAAVLAAAEAAAATAQAFANSQITFDTKAAAVAATVPAGINRLALSGYYAVGDGGAALYRKKAAPELDEPNDITSNGGTVRWGLAEQIPTVLQLGCKADYDKSTGTGTDNGPIINAAFAKWKTIRGVPGHYMHNETVNAGLYGFIFSPMPAGQAVSINAEADDYLDSNTRFVLVPRGLAKVHTVNAMITECELSGGVINNPNAGKAYTTSSGTRLNKFRLVDFTNQDAVAGTITPAAARPFSAAVKVGAQGGMYGVVIRTTRTNGSFISDASDLNFGDAPDVGFYCENPYFATLMGCHASWAFRMYAMLCLNHNAGDGLTPQGDGFKAINCTFEGYRSVGVRGTDQVRVLSATATTIVIPWFKSHRFASSGTVRVDGVSYTYTGLTYTAGSPNTLTFTSVSPSAAGVTAGASLIRGEDYNDSGVGEMEVVGTYIRGLTHAALKFPTDGVFSDRFDSPSCPIEISGSKVRGVHFRGLIGHPRDDLFVFVNDGATITFNGYAEAKDIDGTSAACGVCALSLEQKNAGIGGVPYPVGEASNIQFGKGWDQPLTIDTSPAWRPQTNVGRFGSDWNLCQPGTGDNDWYMRRSRDGTAYTMKAPVPHGNKHPYQWRTAGGSTRMSMDQSGRWQIGFALDTETALPANHQLTVTANGANFVTSKNSASTTFAGFRAENTGGNSDFGVDTDGAAIIRVGGAAYFKVGTTFIRPYADNTHSGGTASFRFTQLFAATATIGTSDERYKADIEAILDILLDAWADVEWCSFRFVDGKRTHFGLIAQRVRDALAKHGLDPFAFGLLCYDEWQEETAAVFETVDAKIVNIVVDEKGKEVELVEIVQVERDTGERRVVVEAGDRFGLRYEECFAIEAAYQRRRMDRLEARLSGN